MKVHTSHKIAVLIYLTLGVYNVEGYSIHVTMTVCAVRQVVYHISWQYSSQWALRGKQYMWQWQLCAVQQVFYYISHDSIVLSEYRGLQCMWQWQLDKHQLIASYFQCTMNHSIVPCKVCCVGTRGHVSIQNLYMAPTYISHPISCWFYSEYSN